MTRQYNNRGQQINIETVQGDVLVHKSTRSNSEWTLLQEVDREVESRLDQSLHNAALINLGKQAQPEQVKRIWDAEVKIGAKPPELLPADVGILEVFERSDIAGKLLILGDPGAGKTTTLLELAQALVDNAKEDANEPIPVLIALSGWQEPCQSMPDWLIEELKSKYGVRKDIGKQWLEDKRLLPLLDGLDEVKPEHQAACVQAINLWLGSDRRPISVVVCSRREEYANSQTQLHLNGAILLQALTDEQIQNYLIRVNRPELWQVLQQDAVLLDLMKTPLLLSITVLSYNAPSLQQWHQFTSTQQRLNLLLDAYIQTMLHREFQSRYYRKHKPPTAAQTRHWLTFLAQQLQRESRTEFLIERMQPSWLFTRKQKRIYRLTSDLILTASFFLSLMLTGGMIILVAFWLDNWVNSQESEEIEPVETLSWSFKKAQQEGMLPGLTAGLIFGLTFGLNGGLLIGLEFGLTFGLISGLIGLMLGLVLGLVFRLSGGLSGSELEIKRSPNQGIWKSAINALLVVLSFGLIFGLIGGLRSGLIDTLIVGLIVGLSSGLISRSGRACIRHFALRFILCRDRSIPWNYARFLNYCTERLFLQRVGGRYRFVHKLLQERFAELGNGE
jgi:DNA polymerase III delta prime subunit